jgi:hypothetical protein
MKFASIVLAVLAAAAQISSTLAFDATDTAVNDVSFTSDSRAVFIDVLANDLATSATKTITDADKTLPNKGGSAVASGTGILYTPLAGFVGVETFGYEVTLGSTSSLTATVTVTVGADPKVSFAIPGQISTAAAIGTVRGGLFNAASFSGASPNAAALTTLLSPVTFSANDDFLANSAFQVVNDNFALIFSDFFSIFRGGGF